MSRTGSLLHRRLFCFRGQVFLLFALKLLFFFLPFPILRVVARKVTHIALPLKYQKMIHHLVHKITVVAHHNHATFEIPQIFLQYLQRDNVQIVGRLVQHQEVRILHQHGAKIQAAALSSAQFIHVVLLVFGRKHEMLQKLHGRQMPSSPKVDIFGNAPHRVDDFHLFVENHPVLRIIPELHRLAHDDPSAVRLHQTQQNLDEGRLAGAVIPYDTHFLIPRESIKEIFQDDFIRSVTFANVVGLEDFATDIRRFHLQRHALFHRFTFCHFLQFVKRFLTITRLMPSGARHAAHPVQFRTIKVVGTRHLGIRCVDTFLTFLQIIAIVPFVSIYGTVVQFQYDGTNPIQKITVVCHHQQTQLGTFQITFKPLYHFQVEMIGRLVQNQQIRFGNQHIGQGHPFKLPARQRRNLLIERMDFQLRQDLLRPVLVVPGFFPLHPVENLFQTRVSGRIHTIFIFPYQIGHGIAMAETSLDDRQIGRIRRRLFQIAHIQVAAEHHASFVISVFSSYYI